MHTTAVPNIVFVAVIYSMVAQQQNTVLPLDFATMEYAVMGGGKLDNDKEDGCALKKDGSLHFLPDEDLQ